MSLNTFLGIILLTSLLVTSYALTPIDLLASSVGAFSSLTDIEQLVEKSQNPFSDDNYMMVAITIINDTPYDFAEFVSSLPFKGLAEHEKTKILMQPRVIQSGTSSVAVYRRIDRIWLAGEDIIDINLTWYVYRNDGSRIPIQYKLVFKDDKTIFPSFSLTSSTTDVESELKSTVYGTSNIPLDETFGCIHFINNRVEVAMHFVTENFLVPEYSMKTFENSTYYLQSHHRPTRRLTDQDHISDSVCTTVVEANKYDDQNQLPNQQQMFWIKRLYGGDFIIYNALTYRALQWDSKNMIVQSCRPPQANLDSSVPSQYRWIISYHPNSNSDLGPFTICSSEDTTLCLSSTKSDWTLAEFNGVTDSDMFSSFAFDLPLTSSNVKETVENANSVTTFNLVYVSQPTWRARNNYNGLDQISERPIENSDYRLHFVPVPDDEYYNIFLGYTIGDSDFLAAPSMRNVRWQKKGSEYPNDYKWSLIKSNTEPPFYLMKNLSWGCYLSTVKPLHEQTEGEDFLSGFNPYYYEYVLSCESDIPDFDYTRFKWKLDYIEG